MKRKIWVIFMIVLTINILMSFSLIGCKERPTVEIVEEPAEEDVEKAEEEEVQVIPEDSGNWIGENVRYNLDAEVAGGKEVSITVWWSTGMIDDWWKETLAKYMDIHPNIKIEYIPFDGGAPEKMILAVKNGDADLVWWNPYWTEYLDPAPFSDELAEAVTKDYIDSAIVKNSDGKVVSISPGLMTGGLMYNKKIWEEEGFTIEDTPETWDEVVILSKQVLDRDENGIITRAGFAINEESFMIHTLLIQSGRFIHNENTGFTNYDKPEALKAAQMVKDWYYLDKIIDPGLPSARDLFGSGILMSYYAWGWENGYMANNYPDIEFGWMPLPALEKGVLPSAYCNSESTAFTCVLNNIPDVEKEVSFDFMTWFMANDEVQASLNKDLGLVPLKSSLSGKTDLMDSEWLNAFNKVKERVTPAEDGIFYGAFTNEVTALFHDMIINNLDPTETMEEAQRINIFAYEGLDIDLDALKASHMRYKYYDEMLND